MIAMPRALVLATLAPLLFAGCSAIGLLDNATQPRDAYELHASADGRWRGRSRMSI